MNMTYYITIVVKPENKIKIISGNLEELKHKCIEEGLHIPMWPKTVKKLISEINTECIIYRDKRECYKSNYAEIELYHNGHYHTFEDIIKQ